jgi:exopolysaccharide biosynthesis polyprenyl glycosylphosphotransferase
LRVEEGDHGAQGGSKVKRYLAKYPLYKYLLAGTDWLILATSFLLAGRMADGLLSASDAGTGLLSPAGLATMLLSSIVSLAIFQSLYVYKANVITTVANQVLRLAAGVVLSAFCFTVLASFSIPFHVHTSRMALLLFSGGSFLGLVIARVIIFRNLFLYFGHAKMLRRNMLVIGAGVTGKNAVVTLFLNRHLGLDVVGLLDDELDIGTPVFRGARVVGRTSDMERLTQELHVREILICVDSGDHARLMELAERCANTSALVKISSPLYNVVPARLMIEHYGDMPVVTVTHARPGPFIESYKRVFDLVLATLAAVVLAPVFAAIAVAIKADAPGPVLYRQTRIGKNGKAFTFYKFRSMRVGSDRDEGRKKLLAAMIREGHAVELMEKGTTKIVNRTQVTRTGSWLRKTSLDELPQLFNVLKGEMSLVGPRPCLPYEWDQYEEWHKKRMSVSPGCTGVWQVSGRSEVGFRDMVVLDLYYIQNASLSMDIKLILKTIPVMVLGKGGG